MLEVMYDLPSIEEPVKVVINAGVVKGKSKAKICPSTPERKETRPDPSIGRKRDGARPFVIFRLQVLPVLHAQARLNATPSLPLPAFRSNCSLLTSPGLRLLMTNLRENPM